MRRRSLPILVGGILLAWCLGAMTGANLRGADADPPAGAGGARAGPDGPVAAPTTSPAIPHDIAVAVAQLGDDDPQVRDAASRKLAAMGKVTLPALRNAAYGDDPEVAGRARRLLAGFRYGIDPDTPAGVMELVNQYRADQGQARRRAIDQLGRMDWAGYRVMARLRRQESDANWRAALAGPLRLGGANVVNAAREMVLAGREDDAEARLSDAAAGGDSGVVRSYVALELARGKVDEALRDLQGEAGDTPGADDALMLAFLCRAKGDAGSALRYARLAPAATPGFRSAGEEMVREILLDRHDWAPLIAEASRHAEQAPNPALRRAALSDKLSCARLAGDGKAFDEAYAAIREAVGQDSTTAPSYAATLLLNDRCAEGIELLVKGKDYSRALQLTAARGRYEDAAKLLSDAEAEKPTDMAILQLTAARRLGWLGDAEAAAGILDRVEKDIEPDLANPAQGDAIETELSLGRTGPAFARAIAVMASSAVAPNNGNTVERALNHIVPNRAALALGWRAYLAEQHPKAPPAEILQKIWALFSRKLSPAEAESLLRDAAGNAAAHENAADRVAIFQRVTETAQIIGREDLADAFFEKWAADPAADASGWAPWKHLGDRAARRKDFPRAADCYEKAVNRATQEPVCLWLHGWASTQVAVGNAEKMEKAKAEMRRADEYLLADDGRWLGFIAAITDASADSTGDAEAQRDIMRRIGEPGSLQVNESYRSSARALLPTSENPDELEVPDSPEAPQRVGPRYLRSADLLSRWMLRIADGELTFNMPEGYLMQPALIHSLRARGLIAGGDIAAAMKEVDLGLAALPANSQLPIDLVPALDRRGNKREADALFQKVAAVLEANLARHPQCAELHNGFAWTCAKCDRELDVALPNARQATRLAPESVAYLDTLAEVQFHRGERQAAIDTMKHCIELDPHFEYLQRQLKRFGGEPAPSPATGG